MVIVPIFKVLFGVKNFNYPKQKTRQKQWNLKTKPLVKIKDQRRKAKTNHLQKNKRNKQKKISNTYNPIGKNQLIGLMIWD
jgi:hypothetical protein